MSGRDSGADRRLGSSRRERRVLSTIYTRMLCCLESLGGLIHDLGDDCFTKADAVGRFFITMTLYY